jgi:hypothetical protein
MNAPENVESATAHLHHPSGRVGNEPKRVSGEGRAKQSVWTLPEGSSHAVDPPKGRVKTNLALRRPSRGSGSNTNAEPAAHAAGYSLPPLPRLRKIQDWKECVDANSRESAPQPFTVAAGSRHYDVRKRTSGSGPTVRHRPGSHPG